MFAYSKKIPTFASLLRNKALRKEFWRGGRVVDCGGLENRCTARYPGFESLSLRTLFFYIQKSTMWGDQDGST